jgi:hypothetical protein
VREKREGWGEGRGEETMEGRGEEGREEKGGRRGDK